MATKSNWYDDIRQRQRVVVDFIRNAIKILGEKPAPDNLQLRGQECSDAGSFYDDIAEMIYHVISSASEVISPSDLCRQIQYDSVWSALFCIGEYKGTGARIVMFKVRHLICNDIINMQYSPSIEGTKNSQILFDCYGVQI